MVVVLMLELLNRINFWKKADRIGPDIPYTHWRLHFNSTMMKLCQRKFHHFDTSAAFRPGAYAICCSKISIGKNVVIRPATMLFADPRPNGATITIEDNVLMGSGIHIYVNNHRFDDPTCPIIEQGHYDSKPVILKTGCWIGANAIILPGVTIGKNAVIGAGSVVTKDVPDGTVALGCPAKVVKYLTK